MSYTYSSDIINHSLNNLININSCGELKLTNDSHIIRPRGRRDYQLIYICEGCSYVKIKGETFIANQGDIIIYRPNEIQDYLLLAKDAPRTYWIHFSGEHCEKLFEDFSIKDINIIKSVHNRDIEYLIAAICKYFNLKANNYPIICSGLLTTVLALIDNSSHNNDSSNQRSNSRNEAIISELISRMKLFHNLEISISDCAKICKMSVSHFTRVFKEITGKAPQQYMIEIRIDRAKELLAFTNKNIAEIAEATGFKDQNYFSRIFKKNAGLTPSEYRKRK